MIKARLFLCYADQDIDEVNEIYHKLEQEGFKPWMAKKDILAGEDWEYAIHKAIKECDFFLVCLTQHSKNKRGYFQKEIQKGLSFAGEQLENDIYMIPLKMDKDCEVPEKLSELQWVNMYDDDAWDRLLRSFNEQIERKKQEVSKKEKLKLFLVAPQMPDDLATEYTISWARQLNDSVQKMNNVELISVLGQDAVRTNVEVELKKDCGNSGLLVFIDHGERDSFLGADDKPVIDENNIDLLNNKFIYAIACRTVSGLGHRAISKGAVGYMGFNNDFHIITTAPDTFGKCFLSGLMAILENNRSPFEAREQIELMINSITNRLRTHFKKSNDGRLAMVITALRHNLDCMVCLGDPNWRIMH
ncbi:toll/interleukin-1 receptor domain-containing protein [Desulfobacterales bacterium HSG17]|nr:toll/interleukin-1 receptor domain-containing protein [Desulfobacterales bacterium HSG17]